VQRFSEVHPIVDVTDFDDLRVAIGGRMRRTDSFSWSQEFTPSTNTGIARKRSRARYHRLKVRIAANAQWSHAQGVNVSAVPAGLR